MTFRRILSACAMSLLCVLPAQAEDGWIRAEGERLFGPDLSENQACRAAERSARQDALRQVTGETVSTEDLVMCSERSASEACELNQITWSQTEGMITDIRGMERLVTSEGGLRRCKIAFEAKVATRPGTPDPNFHLVVRLDRAVYRPGEQLRIGVEPTKPMHVAVFQWLPYLDGDDAVQRIFPNHFDNETLFTHSGSIPRRGGYAFELAFPEKHVRDDRLADEFLVVVGTKHVRSFARSYSLEAFTRALVSLDSGNNTIARRAYVISSQ